MVALVSCWKDSSTPEHGQEMGICREHVGSTALRNSWIRDWLFCTTVKVFSALKNGGVLVLSPASLVV